MAEAAGTIINEEHYSEIRKVLGIAGDDEEYVPIEIIEAQNSLPAADWIIKSAASTWADLLEDPETGHHLTLAAILLTAARIARFHIIPRADSRIKSESIEFSTVSYDKTDWRMVADNLVAESDMELARALGTPTIVRPRYAGIVSGPSRAGHTRLTLQKWWDKVIPEALLESGSSQEHEA